MPKKNESKFFYALSLGLQLGFMIIVPIGGFIFLGVWLDGKFNSLPLFSIVAIILGITITAYEIYHMLIPLIEDQNKNDSR